MNNLIFCCIASFELCYTISHNKKNKSTNLNDLTKILFCSINSNFNNFESRMILYKLTGSNILHSFK